MRFNWRLLWNTTIVVALIGVTGGGITSAIGGLYDRDNQREGRETHMLIERCKNAFGYLADESPNTDLPIEQRQAFAIEQARVALACGRSR